MKKVLIISLLSIGLSAFAQLKEFGFETVYEVKNTIVKSQGNTGTCWAYSTTSFIESEIIRMGGPALDLSEMYFVRHAYVNKAKQYVMLHGKGNFSQGGQAHDIINVIGEHGLVMDVDYPGKNNESITHNHEEMAGVLKSMINNYISQKDASPSDLWYKNISAVLTNYLGELPQKSSFNNRNYSPTEFAAGFGIKKDNYIELTSYTHHPFYKKFDLEVPDNWSHDRYYNLPINELIEVMQNALKNGYSIVWDGDVTEDYFSSKEGLALLPENDTIGFLPQKEKEVSQEDRQKAFYSWQATDDHLMHIVGIVKDKDDKLYFKVKNSWGSGSNRVGNGGFIFMSVPYAKMNTVAIMIHKDALDKSYQKKLFNQK